VSTHGRSRGSLLGTALVVTGALLFVVNAGVSRIAMSAGVQPLTLTTVRVTGSLVVLVVIAAIWRRAALRPPRGAAAWLLVAQGLVGVAALQWTYFVAINRLPVGIALLLEYQAPILVALFARFFQREHVSGRMWWGLVLAVSGLGLAAGVGQRVSLDAWGVVAGLAAAVSFATYFLLGEHGVSRMDPLQVIIWSFGVAAVVLNVVAPVSDLSSVDLAASTTMLGRLGGHAVPLWSSLAWVVLLGTLLPFAAMLYALRHLRATVVTTVAMAEPVGAVLLGWLWFQESLGPLRIIGCTSVVVGIWLAQSARASVPEEIPVT
jgi:drug/metabolite transporter (DMT)-like permease